MININHSKLTSLTVDEFKKKKAKIKEDDFFFFDFNVPEKRPQTNKIPQTIINDIDFNRTVNVSLYKGYISEDRNINNMLFNIILDEISKKRNLKENQLSKGKVFSFVKNFSVQSQKGKHSCIGEFASNENQDSAFLIEHFMLIQGLYIFGVCDGHGINGDKISNNAVKYIPSFIHYKEIEKGVDKKKKNISTIIASLLNSNEIASVRNVNIIKYLYDKFTINPQELTLVKCNNFKEISDLIKDSFITAQKYLLNNLNTLGPMDSGSTICLNILSGKHLYVANLGDSRSILLSYSNTSKKWTYHQLTKDHKPNDPNELKRITNKGGKVAKSKDEENKKEIGPFRVWFKNMSLGPGLAMSRSYGDGNAHKIGVSEEPDIFEYILNEEDKIIITGSDGIFEFLSNDEIMDCISKDFMEGKTAIDSADNLIQLSSSKWKSKSKMNIDDITCVVIFLNVN